MDRLKVLNAILNWRGEFTAVELAERTGVNIATVRTVLHRERRYLEVLGQIASEGRGGRSIRFGVAASRRAELTNELKESSEFLSSQHVLEPPGASYLEPPLTMLSAQDALEREIKTCPDEEEKQRILADARDNLQAARKLLDATNDRTEPFRRLYLQLAKLDAMAETYEMEPELSKLSVWGKVLQNFFGKAAELIVPSTLPAFAGTALKLASSPGVKPNYFLLFENARENAVARYHVAGNQKLPKAALKEAVREFNQSSPHELEIDVPNLSAETIADAICKYGLSKEFPPEALAYLGREPAAYQRGVVERTGDKVIVKPMPFNDALRQAGETTTALGQRVLAAAAHG